MAALPELVPPTIQAIEAAVVAAELREDDGVVRASSIGHACERHLWYRFRWAHEPEAFSGRMLRLFDTGKVEEGRMIAWLRLAGIAVEEFDPATGEQWEVVDLAGHFKGHLDGIATGFPEAPVARHLLECKTHKASSFAELQKHGVAVSKPEHVAQMQVYMHLAGLERGFYLAKNKDTDELYAERVKYDAAAALALIAKAERTIRAHDAPGRLSDNPNYFKCRNCASAGVCHDGVAARRNCRTCLHSTPIGGGGWRCDKFDKLLSREDQAAGCERHLYLPALVDGEQVDADAERGTVTYRRRDGSLWTDGGASA